MEQEVAIVLSFDHELCLGESTSYSADLFDPTDRMLDTADELGVPVALFTDIWCAMRFQQWDQRGFWDPYRRQIHQALQRGHDVQFHLHPHWVTSEYRDGSFRPSADYALSAFRDRPPPDDIPGVIRRGVEFLTTLCRQATADYRCVAYRAGGYALMPETAAILSALYDNGIRIESTVAKGMTYHSSFSVVDFRNMPAKANWVIPPTGPLEAAGPLGLYEVPIVASPRTPWNNLPALVRRVLYHKRRHALAGRGYEAIYCSGMGSEKLKRLFPRSAWKLGFDDHTQSVPDLLGIFASHLGRHRTEAEVVCCTISHPKSMGPYAFGLMRGFVQGVRDKYGDRVRFCTYKQIFEKIMPV